MYKIIIFILFFLSSSIQPFDWQYYVKTHKLPYSDWASAMKHFAEIASKLKFSKIDKNNNTNSMTLSPF